MPLDVGKYDQGDKLTQPDFPVKESSVPTVNGSVAAGQRSAHPTPDAVGPVELQDPLHAAGANVIRK